MNKISLFVSFIVIFILHFWVLTFLYKKEVPEISKPKYQKVSIQLATLKISTSKIEKKVEKMLNVEKSIQPTNDVFNKPIKKEAKRKFVKKIKKSFTKKVVKKTKKKTSKKVFLKKVTKIVKTEHQVNQVSHKEQSQSLKKIKDFKKNYRIRLRSAIDRNKKYPIASKRLGEQGSVMLSFRVLKNGVFQNMKILQSSGKRRLDKAALKAFLLTRKFEAFPKEIKKEYLDFDVSIKFKLR